MASSNMRGKNCQLPISMASLLLLSLLLCPSPILSLGRREYVYAQPIEFHPVIPRKNGSVRGANSARIINGDNAPPGRFTYLAHFPDCCAGTLIAPDIILTAAHCVRCIKDQVLLPAGQKRRRRGMEYKTVDIESIVSHPWYDSEWSNDWDVAICILTESHYGTPIGLEDKKSAKLVNNATVMGYGEYYSFLLFLKILHQSSNHFNRFLLLHSSFPVAFFLL